MTNTQPETYNVRTARGTVHRVTVGRTYKLQGYTEVNRPGDRAARADCGSQTSTRAQLTDETANCVKCLAINV